MTGEVTLRGRVLPIGGLKEKTMAALRNGVHTVLIPRENVKDLDEIDQTVRAGLHFIPVDTVDQVFAAALVPSRGEHAAPRGRRTVSVKEERLPWRSTITRRNLSARRCGRRPLSGTDGPR